MQGRPGVGWRRAHRAAAPIAAAARFQLLALPLILLLGLLGACASTGSEINLAPFWSYHAQAGGGVETEALGGIFRTRATRPGAPFSQLALRPLAIRDRDASENVTDHFLSPFGYATKRGDERVWQLLPITRYDYRITSEGAEEWTLLTLPGIYWSKRADGRILRGWFPFAGVMEQFVSFDRLEWVLFPLWLRTERGGRITNHVVWPVFSVTGGTGGPSWRAWPLFGNSIYRGKYERWFALWPVFWWQRNNLQLPPHAHELKWMVFPIYGQTTAGDYSAHVLLWPFFGWSSNPSNGFWAFDAPWPFVRVLRDPRQEVERTRVWPLWSNYTGDGLESTWWGWPILNDRREIYEGAEKRSRNLVPFLQSWERVDDVGGETYYDKVWPLYQIERRGETESKAAFPAFNPLWRTPDIDAMYAWIWEIYTRERTQDIIRERTWLGLWRREKDAVEDRQSLSALWSTRKYRTDAGRVRETSLLFGLLRWRSGPDAPFQMMLPAFPGPGWPMERGPGTGTVAPEVP